MSLGACLPGLEAEGKLTPEQAAAARAQYDELLEEYSQGMSRETAEALASEATIEALERQVTRKQFLAGRTIKVRGRISDDMGRYGGGNGGDGPINPAAGPAFIDHDPRSGYSNVEARRKAIVGWAHSLLDRVLADHSANMLGKVRNRAQLGDIIREAFGEDSGNHAAKELADAWRQTAERLRQRFNAAGGMIGYRADWGFPASHDWKLVRAAGFDAWRERILPRLDVSRMIDQRTGRPITQARLEAILPEIWETIRTNGWSKRNPGAPGAASMANRHADERFFVFKSADDWAAYNAEFGSGTAYDAMMGHIERMSREIAAMEVLGPNPDATLRWIKGTIEQSAALDRSPDSKAVGAARGAAKKIDELWSEHTGSNLEPRHEGLARWASGLRAFQTATKLGGAYLSATSDVAFQMSRRAFNGLGQASLLSDYLKLMKPGSVEEQKFMVRRGLIAEEWAGRTAAQSRYLLEELTGEVPRRLAEGVLRLSLLSRHTQSMRWMYGKETLATYTEAAGKTLAELDPKLRGALQRYGMSAEDWDKLRSAPMDVDRGAEWISPHNLDDQELASRFMEMIHSEVDLAVPTADLSTRAMFNSRFERGTIIGEVGRSALLFKSFGVSVVMRQGREIMAMSGTNAARYAGGLIIGTTLAGALAIQLKALAAGRDPRPMDDDEFWGAAMLQGGGFGIFGDFLFAGESRTGGGFAQALAGPIVDDLQGINNLIRSDHPERALVREGKGFIPGNNLWYARLVFDRMLADQIQEAIDPDYRQSYRRMERYAAEQGTSYFARPGQLPAEWRAPDFANALEEGPQE